MSRCQRSEIGSQTVRCCPTSGIDVGMPTLCRLGSRGCRNHDLTTSRHKIRLHPACQHVCCLVIALIPCEAPRQRTSSTLPSILSWTISKLKPASRYIFHIPANSEFLQSRDRAQRKRSRSSQQPGSGKQLKINTAVQSPWQNCRW